MNMDKKEMTMKLIELINKHLKNYKLIKSDKIKFEMSEEYLKFNFSKTSPFGKIISMAIFGVSWEGVDAILYSVRNDKGNDFPAIDELHRATDKALLELKEIIYG